MSPVALFVTAVVGFAVACIATGLVRRWALRRGLLDHPNARSSHEVPTPSGGGLGMVAGWLVMLPTAAWLTGETGLLWLTGALLVSATIGFVDDRRPLSARAKFVGMLLASSLLLPWTWVHDVVVPFAGFLPLEWLGAPLTVLWLTLFANAFNFMDGIDGIAGGTAVAAGAVFVAAGVLQDDVLTVVLGLAAVAPALGFLPWNAPRARIFMGDAGSLPLGVLLAAAAVVANRTPVPVRPLHFPVSWVVLGPFIFDVAATLVRRARRGAKLGEAHREHYYQRFADVVGRHPPVSATYVVLTALFGSVALFYGDMGHGFRLLSLLGPLGAMLGFALFVTSAETRTGRAREEA